MLNQGKITMKTVKVTEGTGVSEKTHTVSIGERKKERKPISVYFCGGNAVG